MAMFFSRTIEEGQFDRVREIRVDRGEEESRRIALVDLELLARLLRVREENRRVMGSGFEVKRRRIVSENPEWRARVDRIVFLVRVLGRIVAKKRATVIGVLKVKVESRKRRVLLGAKILGLIMRKMISKRLCLLAACAGSWRVEGRTTGGRKGPTRKAREEEFRFHSSKFIRKKNSEAERPAIASEDSSQEIQIERSYSSFRHSLKQFSISESPSIRSIRSSIIKNIQASREQVPPASTSLPPPEPSSPQDILRRPPKGELIRRLSVKLGGQALIPPVAPVEEGEEEEDVPVPVDKAYLDSSESEEEEERPALPPVKQLTTSEKIFILDEDSQTRRWRLYSDDASPNHQRLKYKLPNSSVLAILSFRSQKISLHKKFSLSDSDHGYSFDQNEKPSLLRDSLNHLSVHDMEIDEVKRRRSSANELLPDHPVAPDLAYSQVQQTRKLSAMSQDSVDELPRADKRLLFHENSSSPPPRSKHEDKPELPRHSLFLAQEIDETRPSPNLFQVELSIDPYEEISGHPRPSDVEITQRRRSRRSSRKIIEIPEELQIPPNPEQFRDSFGFFDGTVVSSQPLSVTKTVSNGPAGEEVIVTKRQSSRKIIVTKNVFEEKESVPKSLWLGGNYFHKPSRTREKLACRSYSSVQLVVQPKSIEKKVHTKISNSRSYFSKSHEELPPMNFKQEPTPHPKPDREVARSPSRIEISNSLFALFQPQRPSTPEPKFKPSTIISSSLNYFAQQPSEEPKEISSGINICRQVSVPLFKAPKQMSWSREICRQKSVPNRRNPKTIATSQVIFANEPLERQMDKNNIGFAFNYFSKERSQIPKTQKDLTKGQSLLFQKKSVEELPILLPSVDQMFQDQDDIPSKQTLTCDVLPSIDCDLADQPLFSMDAKIISKKEKHTITPKNQQELIEPGEPSEPLFASSSDRPLSKFHFDDFELLTEIRPDKRDQPMPILKFVSFSSFSPHQSINEKKEELPRIRPQPVTHQNITTENIVEKEDGIFKNEVLRNLVTNQGEAEPLIEWPDYIVGNIREEGQVITSQRSSRVSHQISHHSIRFETVDETTHNSPPLRSETKKTDLGLQQVGIFKNNSQKETFSNEHPHMIFDLKKESENGSVRQPSSVRSHSPAPEIYLPEINIHPVYIQDDSIHNDNLFNTDNLKSHHQVTSKSDIVHSLRSNFDDQNLVLGDIRKSTEGISTNNGLLSSTKITTPITENLVKPIVSKDQVHETHTTIIATEAKINSQRSENLNISSQKVVIEEGTNSTLQNKSRAYDEFVTGGLTNNDNKRSKEITIQNGHLSSIRDTTSEPENIVNPIVSKEQTREINTTIIKTETRKVSQEFGNLNIQADKVELDTGYNITLQSKMKDFDPFVTGGLKDNYTQKICEVSIQNGHLSSSKENTTQIESLANPIVSKEQDLDIHTTVIQTEGKSLSNDFANLNIRKDKVVQENINDLSSLKKLKDFDEFVTGGLTNPLTTHQPLNRDFDPFVTDEGKNKLKDFDPFVTGGIQNHGFEQISTKKVINTPFKAVAKEEEVYYPIPKAKGTIYIFTYEPEITYCFRSKTLPLSQQSKKQISLGIDRTINFSQKMLNKTSSITQIIQTPEQHGTFKRESEMHHMGSQTNFKSVESRTILYHRSSSKIFLPNEPVSEKSISQRFIKHIYLYEPERSISIRSKTLILEPLPETRYDFDISEPLRPWTRRDSISNNQQGVFDTNPLYELHEEQFKDFKSRSPPVLSLNLKPIPSIERRSISKGKLEIREKHLEIEIEPQHGYLRHTVEHTSLRHTGDLVSINSESPALFKSEPIPKTEGFPQDFVSPNSNSHLINIHTNQETPAPISWFDRPITNIGNNSFRASEEQININKERLNFDNHEKIENKDLHFFEDENLRASQEVSLHRNSEKGSLAQIYTETKIETLRVKVSSMKKIEEVNDELKFIQSRNFNQDIQEDYLRNENLQFIYENTNIDVETHPDQPSMRSFRQTYRFTLTKPSKILIFAPQRQHFELDPRGQIEAKPREAIGLKGFLSDLKTFDQRAVESETRNDSNPNDMSNTQKVIYSKVLHIQNFLSDSKTVESEHKDPLTPRGTPQTVIYSKVSNIQRSRSNLIDMDSNQKDSHSASNNPNAHHNQTVIYSKVSNLQEFIKPNKRVRAYFSLSEPEYLLTFISPSQFIKRPSSQFEISSHFVENTEIRKSQEINRQNDQNFEANEFFFQEIVNNDFDPNSQNFSQHLLIKKHLTKEQVNQEYESFRIKRQEEGSQRLNAESLRGDDFKINQSQIDPYNDFAYGELEGKLLRAKEFSEPSPTNNKIKLLITDSVVESGRKQQKIEQHNQRDTKVHTVSITSSKVMESNRRVLGDSRIEQVSLHQSNVQKKQGEAKELGSIVDSAVYTESHRRAERSRPKQGSQMNVYSEIEIIDEVRMSLKDRHSRRVNQKFERTPTVEKKALEMQQTTFFVRGKTPVPKNHRGILMVLSQLASKTISSAFTQIFVSSKQSTVSAPLKEVIIYGKLLDLRPVQKNLTRTLVLDKTMNYKEEAKKSSTVEKTVKGHVDKTIKGHVERIDMRSMVINNGRETAQKTMHTVRASTVRKEHAYVSVAKSVDIASRSKGHVTLKVKETDLRSIYTSRRNKSVKHNIVKTRTPEFLREHFDRNDLFLAQKVNVISSNLK